MDFLRQADSRRYGIVLADLENDYMKGDTNYPLDIPSAYRFLDEFKLDKSGKESHKSISAHIAFAQGYSEPECYGCGLPAYTKINCPRCNKIPSKKPFDPKKSPKPKFKHKPTSKRTDKNFAWTDGRNIRRKTEKPALGFVQLADVQDNEQGIVRHCFTTVGNVKLTQELAKSEKEPSYSDQGLTYEPNQNNMTLTKFS